MLFNDDFYDRFLVFIGRRQNKMNRSSTLGQISSNRTNNKSGLLVSTLEAGI